MTTCTNTLKGSKVDTINPTLSEHTSKLIFLFLTLAHHFLHPTPPPHSNLPRSDKEGP